ncbi:S8 family serine peptidase [Pseudarthrobacter sp. DSP2-3-2b1]|uniref:S8 family serine peptidase n=1 Tax=Pseudarthrobacter sp. DSP2-3-2b1 TaxID=2804661 RepID=UPI003CEC9124
MLPRPRNGNGAGKPLTGAGVIVAFLDWGIDVTHQCFRRDDGFGADGLGSTRIVGIWDQRGGASPLSPEPFGYGRVLDADAINKALSTRSPQLSLGYDWADVDPQREGSHGTHVADVGTGNGRAPGASPGVAPGCDILFCHLSADDTRPEDSLADSARLLEGFAWCLDAAQGRPLVVNVSAGRTGGSHDPYPLAVQAFDYALATVPGLALVLSGGNYYEARLSAKLDIATNEVRDLLWEIPDRRSHEAAEMEIWYAPEDRLRAAIYSPDGTQLADLPLGKEAIAKDNDILLMSGFHRHRDPNSGSNVVNIFVQAAAPPGTYPVRLYGEKIENGVIHAWIERTRPAAQSRFSEDVATSAYSTGSLSHGHLPLSVAAYDANDPEKKIASFSSVGPSRDGRRKPDLAAPGSSVVAARSSIIGPDGQRLGNGLVSKSGTSMAAPHVSGTIALVFETFAPRKIPMQLTRWLLLESVQHHPPDPTGDDRRYGAGRLDAAAACSLALALVEALENIDSAKNMGSLSKAPEGVDVMNDPLRRTTSADVFRWLSPESILPVGQLLLGKTQLTVTPRDPTDVRLSFDDAAQAALARSTEHTLITSIGSPPTYKVEAFGPQASLIAPPVAGFDGPADIMALSINGGDRFLMPENPGGPGRRRVDVPELKTFYALPAQDADRYRNRLADRLAASVQGIQPMRARALSLPLLRVILASNAAAAFPVQPIRRGKASYDAGGLVSGVTPPLVSLPIQEPRCYLPVIAEVEGKLESINAWDAGAGVSLGPIQFNVDRGALFRFLWALWTEDQDLFRSAFSGPSLDWTMTIHEGHPDLLVARSGLTDTLHGKASDRESNAAYLQTGQPGKAGRDPKYRRMVAAAFRDCVVWPHVQDLILDVSAWWLAPALEKIRAEGIGPLDPRRPDRDTFVLTAMLLSAGVRFSGCLTPLLVALRTWTTALDKLAHWEEALQQTSARCQELHPRLKKQEAHANRTFQQIQRLLNAAQPSGMPAPSRTNPTTN